VDISGSDDKVIISVKDSGLGIPTEDISHLFQKFYRVSNLDRQEIGGTGLGLYLSRRLVEAMQGRLWVESIFGTGSTFYVELPRITSDQAAQLKQQQSQQAAVAAQAAQQQVPAIKPTLPVTQSTPVATPVAVQPVAQPISVQTAPAAAVNQAASTPQQAPRPQPPQLQPATRPATTVPRGEALTRDQIAERVRQLEQLALQQRAEQNSGQGR
jgi:hypothetical protein